MTESKRENKFAEKVRAAERIDGIVVWRLNDDNLELDLGFDGEQEDKK